MEGHEHRLIERMKSKGISEQFAERVYEQIKGFGEYGFPESHAASFALISYATAFLKRHFPAHFYAALINAQPMGFYSVSTLVYGAQREGVTVLPIDVRFSTWESTLELAEGRLAIRMGFRSIKGLGSQQNQNSTHHLAPKVMKRSAHSLVAYSSLAPPSKRWLRRAPFICSAHGETSCGRSWSRVSCVMNR